MECGTVQYAHLCDRQQSRKQACPAQAIHRKLNGKEAISTISAFSAEFE